MIAAELRGDNRPNLNEALGWIGSRVDDIYGAQIGRLEDVWIDPGTGQPRWLLIKEGRFGGRATLIPFEDATAGAGHVWVPYEREVVRDAPQIEPGAPLTQQVEVALRRHYAANSPAAFERAEQLGSNPEVAEAGVSGRQETGESPSAQMPDRPAPPVAAPGRAEGAPEDEPRGSQGSDGDVRRQSGSAAQGEGERRSSDRQTSSPPEDPAWQGPSAGQQSWPPPPGPAYYQPVMWPYPQVPAPMPPPMPPAAPYGYGYGYAGMPYPPPPAAPGQAAASDPLAGLAGREIEIELEGPVRISGTVRSLRFKSDSD